MTKAPAAAPLGRLLIVGGTGGTNVGDSFLRAATTCGIEAMLLDTAEAYRAPWIVARVNWWLRHHRPSRLGTFSQRVVDECRRRKPRWLLATGSAPIERLALDAIAALGVRTISFLTDDPWNPSSRSEWFLDALPAYARVYSPRRANLDDLARHGCRHVAYLPFAVDPDLFFPDTLTEADHAQYGSDVFFAGGADRERVPFIAELLRARMRVRLHGDYWHRYPETREAARGPASVAVVRKSILAAAVCLCLVRRANRDGHSMRSFEIPAVGGCMVAEDTDEHRAIFGPDGDAVVYFRTPSELVHVTEALVGDSARRGRLADRAHHLIATSPSTYRERLCAMLGVPAAKPTVEKALSHVG